ncbi:MAG: hypothetical protein IPQ08_08750 [Chitinophagaceae bacterium]|nr:hypothetical protein [Chitinophagaceae bacterium]
MNDWTEGIHYYLNEEGFVVFTEKYHLEKGFCCGNGCLHCPFQYENVPEPRRSALMVLKPCDANSIPPGDSRTFS